MKKATLLFFVFVITISAYCQDSLTKFAIVDLSASGDKYYCTVKYSNGTEFSLVTTLQLSVAEMHLITGDEMELSEFKILAYFYKKSYDLLSVTGRENQKHYYFKLKTSTNEK